jgi:hypothetical protein
LAGQRGSYVPQTAKSAKTREKQVWKPAIPHSSRRFQDYQRSSDLRRVSDAVFGKPWVSTHSYVPQTAKSAKTKEKQVWKPAILHGNRRFQDYRRCLDLRRVSDAVFGEPWVSTHGNKKGKPAVVQRRFFSHGTEPSLRDGGFAFSITVG